LKQTVQPAGQPQKSPTKYRVPALEKGLDILEALAFASTPQSLAELARTLGRSSSEIFRMCTCLESRRYIARDERSGNYSLTLKLYELAHTHSPVDNLLKAAARPMEELAQSLRESCHLSVIRGGRLVVLSQALSPEKVRLSVEVGGRFSLIHSISGPLLLAQLPPDDLATLLTGDRDYQTLSEAEQSTFQAELAEIREKGYALARDRNHLGVTDYAVPVGNPNIGLTAALAIGALTATRAPGDGQKILRALQESAKSITETLGLSLSQPNMSF
jgi:DNA-binding IclR family transcriptional regulator